MNRTRRNFYYLLAAVTLLKLVLAALLPLTGDEAYFFLWGKYLALGYYDHPPMVGWWLHLLLYAGQADWWLRLPAVLLTSFIGWAIYRIWRGELDEPRAALAGMLYLLMPIDIVDVLISTDTPLILFSFLSAWALHRALARESGYRWFVYSGLLLGLAFLSKYFAVLLGLTYGVYLLLLKRGRRNAIGLLLLFLAVLPFAAYNVWWNYDHCWDNILFNLYNRRVGSHEGGWSDFVTYVVMVLYLLTPPLLWYGWRVRHGWLGDLRRGDLFGWLWLLPMLLFAGLAFIARIGLHWVLAFYPFLFLLLPRWLDGRQLRRSVQFNVGFSLLHVVAIAAVLMLPYSLWKNHAVVHYDLIFGAHPEEFWQQMAPYAANSVVGTDDYIYSAIMEHETGRYFIVMGDASKYGRQDDIQSDYRTFNGKDMAVLFYAEKSIPLYGRYFDSYQMHEIHVRGATGYLLVGHGFHYQAYRDAVLQRIRHKFYRLPWFLPCGKCYFYDRYFPNQPRERLPHQ